jgi:hypothetical protein
MDMRHIQKLVLSKLGERVAPLGFRKRPDQSFEKRFDWGRTALHLCFMKHDDDFDVVADVAVRFDALEELINRNNTGLSEKRRKETFSIGVELGNLSQRRPIRWTVGDESDVEPAVDQILDRFLNIGIPYIEEFSDLRRVLEVLANDGPDSWLYSPFDGRRAKQAVAVAWLLRDEERLRSLIAAKAAFLERRVGLVRSASQELADFQEFVGSLDLGAH